jgi:hypothetical protein
MSHRVQDFQQLGLGLEAAVLVDFHTIAKTAGLPLKVISEALGHGLLAITADTYTSVLISDLQVTVSAAHSGGGPPGAHKRAAHRSCQLTDPQACWCLATMARVGSVVWSVTAQPVEPAEGPDVGSYEMLHLGDQSGSRLPRRRP